MTPKDKKWLRGLYTRIMFATGVIVFTVCYVTTTALLTFVYDVIPLIPIIIYYYILTYFATIGLSVVATVAHRDYWRYLNQFISKFSDPEPSDE